MTQLTSTAANTSNGKEKKKKKQIDLNDRHLSSKHKNNAHLEQHPERVPYVVRAELLEALRAITALEEERIPHGGLREPLLEPTRLAGEHDRREALDRLEHGAELLLVRVLRQLQRLLRLPAVDGPFPGPRGWRAGGGRRRRGGGPRLIRRVDGGDRAAGDAPRG